MNQALETEAGRLVYPKRIGIAADLVHIVPDRRAFLADCLLLYDQIVIPTDPNALNMVYSFLAPDQVERLVKAQRVLFCPAVSFQQMNQGAGPKFKIDSYLPWLSSQLEAVSFSQDAARQIVSQVERNLILGAAPDYRRWLPLCHEAEEAFVRMSSAPGYGFLAPIDPRTGYPNQDRWVGLMTGLARVSDLAAVGVGSYEMDDELNPLLNICFPSKDFSPDSGLSKNSLKAIETSHTLHRIENLPPLGTYAAINKWSDERLVNTLLSDEAEELRAWMFLNMKPGMNFMEAYVSATKSLPSKKHWNSWLRFGSVAGFSTAVTALITDPVTGAVVGNVIGAVDNLIGPRIQQEISDPFHPDAWLSYVKRNP